LKIVQRDLNKLKKLLTITKSIYTIKSKYKLNEVNIHDGCICEYGDCGNGAEFSINSREE
jgi:hypothetical protein